MEQLIEISKALLTPIIAMITTYIAWQQWRTNRQKLNLERYDRRLHVYEEVRKILRILVNENASMEDLLKYYTAVSEADFLFGPEIPKYIDDIYKHGLSLRRWNQEYRNSTQQQPEGYDHNEVVDEKHKEWTWLSDQFEPAKAKFKKYLDISK